MPDAAPGRSRRTPKHWPHDQARLIAQALGSRSFGWSSFQLYWSEIVETDPDLFD